MREMDQALERFKKRGKFNLEQKGAITPRDMQQAILDLNPQIVHFSGHGSGEGGLALADESVPINHNFSTTVANVPLS